MTQNFPFGACLTTSSNTQLCFKVQQKQRSSEKERVSVSVRGKEYLDLVVQTNQQKIRKTDTVEISFQLFELASLQ